jgi:hypothetical protein
MLIYHPFSSIDSVSSWHGALFQNRTYWDSSAVFWIPEFTQCLRANWVDEFTTFMHNFKAQDKNRCFCKSDKISILRPRWPLSCARAAGWFLKWLGPSASKIYHVPNGNIISLLCCSFVSSEARNSLLANIMAKPRWSDIIMFWKFSQLHWGEKITFCCVFAYEVADKMAAMDHDLWF